MSDDPIAERDALREQVRWWENWSNDVADLLPDYYDGDETQETIILRAVGEMAARLAKHEGTR
jgi:hypothetical protein